MKQKIDGVLLLDKPLGMSSNAALQKVKWLYGAKKAGHTGTLDPLATGLLPICFGEATKFASFLLDGNKEYIATVKLGVTTTTYDAEGDIVATIPVTSSEVDIRAVVASFLGCITQTPPIYSALKVDGRALYEYARAGIEVEIKTREVEIFECEVLEFTSPDVFRLRVVSSKGTYIRSLAHDIGVKLGCGASLVGLVRTKSNDFMLNRDTTVEHISNLSPEAKLNALLPVDILVQHLPRLELTDAMYAKVCHGHQFESKDLEDKDSLRLYYNGVFLGVASVHNGKVKPIRLCNN